jgi:3-(3-hydroxy-phenyl)propionate hydroxylase
MSLPVGIVGAGPVGLTLALRLASFGVPSVVLEAEPGLRRQGSKACLIQGDVLEILDKVGCAREIAETGVTWSVGHTYVRGREIRRTDYPMPVGFGPFVNISQYRIEQVLLARVQAEPLTRVRWSHRVTGVEEDRCGVSVRIDGPDGPREMRFGHVVACDGVRSTMRDLAGVEWTGYTHRDRFLITDIQAKLPLAKERHFHYDPPFNPGRQVIMHPQPDEVWRIDWQLPPDADIEAERADGRLDKRIRAVIGDVPYEIHWLSTYRFHQRVVDRMRVSRVFFAGDAAHALPPYGARGMNSGLQDADNLAWKLAAVLDGRAGDDLLDTYHDERHAAAEENLRLTEATIRFMVPPNRRRRLARNALLRLAPAVRSARRHVNSGRMAEPFVYSASSIVHPRPGSTLPGRMAPDALIRTPDGLTRMRRLFGESFVLVRFGEGLAHPSLPVILVRSEPAAISPAMTAVAPVDESLRAAYGSPADGTWFLVRPDGHIAATGTAADQIPLPIGSLREVA